MELNKRFQFSISTSSTCFLCFEEITQFNKNGEETTPEITCSLQNIFLYLKIKLSEINSLSKKPEELLNKTDFKVSLCQGCLKEFERFSVNFQALELSRMRVEASLEVILKKLKGSTETCVLEGYGSRIQDDLKALKHSVIVKELRDEALRKCNSKRQAFQPRINLKKTANNRGKEDYNEGLLEDPSSTPSFPVPLDCIKIELDPLEKPQIPDESHEASVPQNWIETEGAGSPKNIFNRKKERWRTHKVHIDPKTEFYKCPYCPKTFKLIYSCREHLRLHLGEGLKCSFCPKILQSKQCRRIHERFHTGERPYKCPVCGVGFVNKSGLQYHMGRTHEFNNLHLRNKIFGTIAERTCKICLKISSTKTNLKIHLKTHSGAKPFKCNYCENKYSKKETLVIHMRSHSMDTKDNHFDPAIVKMEVDTHSEDISYQSEDPREVKNEIIAPLRTAKDQNDEIDLSWRKFQVDMNNETGLFDCPFCSKTFKLLYSCREHIRLHLGQGLKCSFCPKVLQSKQCLRIHERFHTGERPYKCKSCERSFVNMSGLNYHVSTRHAGKKDETEVPPGLGTVEERTCSICSFVSTSKYNLRVHVNNKHKVREQRLKSTPGVVPFSKKKKIFNTGNGKITKKGRSNENPEEYKCQLCDKILIDKIALAVHSLQHRQKGRRWFKCVSCPMEFSEDAYLNDHVKAKHNGPESDNDAES